MIFSGDKPLFNRKYLLALVWLLPLAIVALNQLAPESDPAAQRIAPQQLWSPSKKSQVGIYFSQGSGLTSNDRARQALLLEGLALRLDDPEINKLLYQQGWRVKPQSSSLFTALNITTKESIDTTALARFIDLLQQPPSIDWTARIERITAEAYVAAQNGRQRALNSLLSSGDPQLSGRTYVELVDQPIYLLFQAPEEPLPLELDDLTPLSSLLPGKSSVSVRSKKAGLISLWQMPPATSSETYLAQQAFGLLVSRALETLPETRILQQLTPQGSLLIVETASSQETLAAVLGNITPESLAVRTAIDALEERWADAAEQSPLAWAEATLLYNLGPDRLTDALKTLKEQQEPLLAPLIQRLHEGASRRARLFTAQTSES